MQPESLGKKWKESRDAALRHRAQQGSGSIPCVHFGHADSTKLQGQGGTDWDMASGWLCMPGEEHRWRERRAEVLLMAGRTGCFRRPPGFSLLLTHISVEMPHTVMLCPDSSTAPACGHRKYQMQLFDPDPTLPCTSWKRWLNAQAFDPRLFLLHWL